MPRNTGQRRVEGLEDRVRALCESLGGQGMAEKKAKLSNGALTRLLDERGDGEPQPGIGFHALVALTSTNPGALDSLDWLAGRPVPRSLERVRGRKDLTVVLRAELVKRMSARGIEAKHLSADFLAEGDALLDSLTHLVYEDLQAKIRADRQRFREHGSSILDALAARLPGDVVRAVQKALDELPHLPPGEAKVTSAPHSVPAFPTEAANVMQEIVYSFDPDAEPQR